MYLWGLGTPARDRYETCLSRFAKFSLSPIVVVFKNCTLFRVWHLPCKDYRIKIIHIYRYKNESMKTKKYKSNSTSC